MGTFLAKIYLNEEECVEQEVEALNKKHAEALARWLFREAMRIEILETEDVAYAA